MTLSLEILKSNLPSQGRDDVLLPAFTDEANSSTVFSWLGWRHPTFSSRRIVWWTGRRGRVLGPGWDLARTLGRAISQSKTARTDTERSPGSSPVWACLRIFQSRNAMRRLAFSRDPLV